MKKLLLPIVLICAYAITGMAQAPEKFSYQAVIRDASNNLVVNQNVGLQISIRQYDAMGTIVYQETHTAMTNINGLVSLEVGGGATTMGTFAGIDWGDGPYYIQTEIDPAGGVDYSSIMGTTELISVPYALYAANSVLAFAEFYALMPPDNAATVAPGTAVDFPQDGPSDGSGTIVRTSANTFQLSEIGTYNVSWQVSISEAGQLMLRLNGADVAYTVVGRATGTSQITGNCLITTTVPDSILSVINPAENIMALFITPWAGGTRSVSASLVIMRIQ